MENGAGAPDAARPPQRRGSTPFRGVRIIKPSGKYGAEITVPGKRRRVWLGTFGTPEDAAVAYDDAARSFGIPESRMNFPAPYPFISSPSSPNSEESSTEAAAAAATDQLDLNVPPPQR